MEQNEIVYTQLHVSEILVLDLSVPIISCLIHSFQYISVGNTILYPLNLSDIYSYQLLSQI